MTAYQASSFHQSSHCMMSAAAGTSARLGLILDTAIAAVSIFVIHILGILVLML